MTSEGLALYELSLRSFFPAHALLFALSLPFPSLLPAGSPKPYPLREVVDHLHAAPAQTLQLRRLQPDHDFVGPADLIPAQHLTLTVQFRQPGPFGQRNP